MTMQVFPRQSPLNATWQGYRRVEAAHLGLEQR